jgi:DNA replication ATP-dependent helicase Dna2
VLVLYGRPYFYPDNWSKLTLVLTSFQILSVKDEKTHLLKLISLRQSWFESRCTKGSYVHLIGDFDHAGQCIVDDADNMIILHPDHLISATVVADSFTCARRAVLQDRVKATGAAEKTQVYGHMLHEVFGEALKANEWNADRLKTVIEQVVLTYIEPLYEINVDVPEAVNHLMSKIPELSAWASLFISPRPTTEAVVQDRNGAIAFMSINKLIEVEEHIWSPMYGLKGNVDATVQVALQQPGESCARTLTVPLEFKTGRKDNNEMHRAQTQLYTLLMSDRYDLEVTTGVLYYLETAKTSRVEGIRHEIRHMIIQRNELACYVRDKLELPPMIKKPHMCKNCYAQTSCFVYHKLVESGNGDTSGMKEIFDDAMRHLQPTHEAFFKKWDALLTKEERDAMKFRRELWTMLSSERETLGRCFSNVIIEPGSAQENVDSPKINRFQYTFVKPRAANKFSFTESQLTIGEPIVVSDEDGHFALANGYITNVRPSRVTVAVDRKLHNARQKEQGFDVETNQVFTGIMDLTKDKSLPATTLTPDLDKSILYRVDKDEFSNGMATARNNLIRLMESNLFRARELRKLIIEQQRPSFKPTSSAYSLFGLASQQDLNVDQRRAIEKVMSAKDYALVLGMPGTGKTTTIAHIIRALVSQGKSVLLASYTHTAVDNILLKIKDDNIPVFRLGAVGRVHPEVQSFAQLGGIPKKTIEELENSYVNSKVVATTCLGINQPIFNTRIFDYCIVDEASQITLPVCLGPIRMARTFILVGDHFQLPPLVQNKEAQEGGLDISLFKLLSEAQPDSVVNLEHQYRMAEDIMMLSNELIYSGRLKCGTPEVASRIMQIPNVEAGLAAHHHNASSLSTATATMSICTSNSACWLRRSLSPKPRCLFLNTDTLVTRAPDIVSGSRITNPAEATLTSQLVTTLIRSGVSPRSIGVITFYRSQLALLRQELKMVAGATVGAEVEMHTADKFQGRDKEVVLLSCVRSNDAHNIGDLLKDWRRVNVAVTRARSKLIIIGSKQTLGSSRNEVVEGLVKLMDGKGWVYDLPTNALDDHAFQNGSQASGKLRREEQSTKSLGKRAPSTSPCKQGSFRKPTKTVRGSVDVEKLLEKRPVMMDIVNSI